MTPEEYKKQNTLYLRQLGLDTFGETTARVRAKSGEVFRVSVEYDAFVGCPRDDDSFGDIVEFTRHGYTPNSVNVPTYNLDEWLYNVVDYERESTDPDDEFPDEWHNLIVEGKFTSKFFVVAFDILSQSYTTLRIRSGGAHEVCQIMHTGKLDYDAMIYVSVADAAKEFGWGDITCMEEVSDEQAKQVNDRLENTLDTLSSWLEGNTWWVKVEKEVGEDEYEDYEACGWFIGDHAESGLAEWIRETIGENAKQLQEENK